MTESSISPPIARVRSLSLSWQVPDRHAPLAKSRITPDVVKRLKDLKDKAMSPLLISLLAFTCIFGGTFLGLFIRYRLPDRHLSGDTRDIVRQGTAVIATLAPLCSVC